MKRIIASLATVALAACSPVAASENETIYLQGTQWVSCEVHGLTGSDGQVPEDLSLSDEGECGLVFTMRLTPEETAGTVAYEGLWAFKQKETGSISADFTTVKKGGEFPATGSIASLKLQDEGGDPLPTEVDSIQFTLNDDGLLEVKFPGTPAMVETLWEPLSSSLRPPNRPETPAMVTISPSE